MDSCDAGSNASGECYQTLNSFNLLDKSVVTEFNLSEVIGSNVVFGLAIEDHLAYVSVWQDCSILEVDLSSGAIRTLADHLGREVLFSIALTGDSISTNETRKPDLVQYMIKYNLIFRYTANHIKFWCTFKFTS